METPTNFKKRPLFLIHFNFHIYKYLSEFVIYLKFFDPSHSNTNCHNNSSKSIFTLRALGSQEHLKSI